MIAFLKGIVENKNENTCLLDVNGVGYEVSMPTPDIQRLPGAGQPATIYTWHVQREDGQQLYGFLQASDRRLFKTLLGVANVGPKSALAVLSGMTQAQLEEAVAKQDIAAFSGIPGIGRKTAERLLLELKDKLEKVHAAPLLAAKMAERDALGEALEALLTLGYSSLQARAALQKVVDQELPPAAEDQDRVAEFVRRALKVL
ncbi:Holliday junction branch migration protein RuvA [candidate division FCPU426 bacterium]|nr:Holliday junction branch migration protein RuvA [candidate division FCPU426 bacterium]